MGAPCGIGGGDCVGTGAAGVVAGEVGDGADVDALLSLGLAPGAEDDAPGAGETDWAIDKLTTPKSPMIIHVTFIIALYYVFIVKK